MAEQASFTDRFRPPNFDFMKFLSEFDEGVIITDASGRIVFYNQAQAAIDGLDAERAIGRRVTKVYRLTSKTSMIMRCIHSGKPIVNQLFYYRPRHGTLCNAIHSVYPLWSGARIEGAICFMKDSDLLEKTCAVSASLVSNERVCFENGTRFTFADIIGGDPGFLDCLKRARSAAASRSPIMVVGETGTGKEMLAQSIHNFSPRRSGPFVAVNCAAIPESLQESTLFGTTRGAFTGAVDKQGLFEEARGGTLYLDEVDAMPENLQVKLLRVLQESRIRRVGSAGETPVDVRVVSSINREFGTLPVEGSLRKDLYYRLGVVQIEIPPLRARRHDLEALSRHFLDKSNFTLDTRVEGVSAEALELFMNYPWPGNVRELEHVIEGAINIIGGEDVIEIEHLPSYFTIANGGGENGQDRVYPLFPVHNTEQLMRGLARLKATDSDPEFSEGVSLSASQHRREKELIASAMEKEKGNVSGAARRLGISRQLLHYKLKKYEIDRSAFR